MKELTTIQDKIEEKAVERLTQELDALDKKFRKLIDEFAAPTGDVRIKLSNETNSYPYLNQLLSCEQVRSQIREQLLPVYVDRAINNLLNGNVKI